MDFENRYAITESSPLSHFARRSCRKRSKTRCDVLGAHAVRPAFRFKGPGGTKRLIASEHNCDSELTWIPCEKRKSAPKKTLHRKIGKHYVRVQQGPSISPAICSRGSMFCHTRCMTISLSESCCMEIETRIVASHEECMVFIRSPGSRSCTFSLYIHQKCGVFDENGAFGSCVMADIQYD